MIKVAELREPQLRSVRFDPASGLTPDSAAALAVLLNPQIRSLRSQKQLASAQLLTAGILPNPQFNFSQDIPYGGIDTGSINQFGLGLDWEITSLITRDAKVQSARASSESIDLSVAWQEWQIAQAARIAVFDLVALRQELALAQQVDHDLRQSATNIRKAVDTHDKTVLDLAAADAASGDAHTTVQQIARDTRRQELALARAIGLPPTHAIKIDPAVALPSRAPLPSEDELAADFETHRLDLLALRRGYQSQEQTLRAAVLAQFPRVSLGFSKMRDTFDVKTVGFGVVVDVPIFDRNQGVIAQETATRERLFDEYCQRVFETRADIAAAIDDVQAIEDQLDAQQAAIPSLQKLVDTYRVNLDRGNVDVLSYYTALGNLVAKQIDVLKLQQQLADNRIALEIAIGRYIPDDSVDPTTRPQ